MFQDHICDFVLVSYEVYAIVQVFLVHLQDLHFYRNCTSGVYLNRVEAQLSQCVVVAEHYFKAGYTCVIITSLNLFKCHRVSSYFLKIKPTKHFRLACFK